jgi:hypothetical protein
LSDGSIPDPNVETWSVGDCVIVHAWGGGGNLLGPPAFEGIWIHDEWMVVHPSGIATVIGTWDTPEGVTFHDDGDEYYGTVHVLYWGKWDPFTGNPLTSVFHGRWVILSGTGDLEDLRGHGTVWFDFTVGGPFLQGILHYRFVD